MRHVESSQPKLGQLPIGEVRISTKSRDDIPALLLGLQAIYTTPELRGPIFSILQEVIPYRVINNDGENGSEESTVREKANPNSGRPGMDQWKILVLGTLRLGTNSDYDRLHDLANNHNTLRQMLGHSDWADDTQYSLQSIKDNLMLFTPEILDRINVEVVQHGHSLLKKKGPTPRRATSKA